MSSELKKEAPAPEGGEVKGPGGYLVKDFADGWYWTPNAALDHASGASVWSVADGRYETDPPAPATREEAPAEAGERRVSSESELKRIVKDLITHRRAGDYDLMADDVANCLWPHLRAQPPAREDAQPVGWRYKLDDETARALFRPGWNFQEHKPPVQWGPYGRLITEAEPLYTHPAPDALRVAAEALEPFAKGGHHRTMPGLSPSYTVADFGDGVVVTVADFRRAAEALAVMQAEQKGGA